MELHTARGRRNALHLRRRRHGLQAGRLGDLPPSLRFQFWWFSALYMGAAAVVGGVSFAIEAPFLSAFLLPFLVPMPSVSVRWLHDTGKSGRGMLIALIPAAGPIVYLLGMAVDGAPGTNYCRIRQPSPCCAVVTCTFLGSGE
ncbi:DUF805 domain-containing protein [Streptomyces sp. NPDC050549]|uniref:DUF805 domain-containing protein n=1 Tax=Streptomyces sp. NPDC050549 TaxID=3155406 RepID=UPI003443EEB1